MRENSPFISSSTQGANVQIVNLSSVRGQQMNGRVTKINGPLNNGRYPIILRHISGDVEGVSLKAQNLNPFFELSEEEELSEAKRQAFVSYGHPIGGFGGDAACTLEGHGRMFKNCITALKWYLMHIQPMPFFVNLTMDEFAEQVEGDPRAQHLTEGIYDMYRVIPNEMEQTGQFQAGITGFPMHLSLYSMLVWQLLMNERAYVDYEGEMVARCGLDGEGGSKIIHNYCRFANVWDTERIAGNIWVVRIARYGIYSTIIYASLFLLAAERYSLLLYSYYRSQVWNIGGGARGRGCIFRGGGGSWQRVHRQRNGHSGWRDAK